MNWFETGRFLIIAGSVILVLGIVFVLAEKVGLGKLPGDFSLGSGRFKIYLPVATCIVLSILLTLILNFFSRK